MRGSERYLNAGFLSVLISVVNAVLHRQLTYFSRSQL